MAADNQGPTLIAVTVVFWAFALIAIGLRFWTLQIRKRKVAAHDVFILLAFFFATALAVCVIVSVELGGLGQHAVELLSTPWKFEIFGKLLIAIQIIWCCAMTCVRLSILCLYIDLFSKSRPFRLACYVFMAICALWFCGEFLVVFLLCTPLEYQWNKAINGSCGNLNAAYLTVHGSNFAIDSSIALLPAPVLWGLKMPTARKLGIIVMFALGACICAIAIARIGLYQLALTYDQTDFTYSGSILYLFTSLEPLVACWLACMPLLQPVADLAANSAVVSWAKSLVTSSSRTRTENSTMKSSRRVDYLPTSSQEGLHHTQVTAGGWKDQIWAGPEGRVSGERGATGGIHVNRGFERNSFELVRKSAFSVSSRKDSKE